MSFIIKYKNGLFQVNWHEILFLFHYFKKKFKILLHSDNSIQLLKMYTLKKL